MPRGSIVDEAVAIVCEVGDLCCGCALFRKCALTDPDSPGVGEMLQKGFSVNACGLYEPASPEADRKERREHAGAIRVKDVLAKKGSQVTTVWPGATVWEASERMNAIRTGSVVVVDGDEVVGVFTERDVLCRVVAAELPSRQTPVAEVMTKSVVTCNPDTPLAECEELISTKRIRHLPVLEDGKLVGIISSGDIMAYQMAEKQRLIHYMDEYIQGRS